MRIIKKENVYVEKVNLPVTRESSRTVYFVSGDNNRQFGHFKTQQEAMKQFDFILSLPREDRTRHDQ